MYEIAKQLSLDEKDLGNKSTRDKSLNGLLKPPNIMVSASCVSNTIFLSSDPKEFCDRFKILLQEKQAGNTTNLVNEEVVAIAGKLLE